MIPPPRIARNQRSEMEGDPIKNLGITLLAALRNCERCAPFCGNFREGKCIEGKCFCFEVEDCERWHQQR